MSAVQSGSTGKKMNHHLETPKRPSIGPGGPKYRLALALVLAIAAPVYVACQGNVADGTATENTAAASDLLRVPVSSQNEKPFAAFNRQAREAAVRGEAWPRDPILFTRRFSGRHTERLGAWSMEGSGERPSRYRIVAISDGFLDDSVRGERLHVVLTRGTDEIWQIAEAHTSVRCWEDRGHQDFSAQPCR